MIFREFAEKYYESNLSIIPLNGKKAFTDGWTKYCKELPDENTISKWMNEHPKANIGLCCGQASQIIAFDVDTDDKEILSIIRAHLPYSPISKKGKKGITWFYKYSNQKSQSIKLNGKTVVDILSDGKQTVIPPSIHPETKTPYMWVEGNLIDFDELPDLSQSIIDKISSELNKTSSPIPNDLPKGRNDLLVSFVGTIYDKLAPHEAIRKLIAYDSNQNDPPLFLDVKEGYDPRSLYENAEKFYHSVGRTILNEKKRRGEVKILDASLSVDQEKFNEFFLTGIKLKGPIKDILTEKVFYSHPIDSSRWVTGDELMPLIKSHGKAQGLPQSQIQTEFQRFELEHKKLDFLIDIPEWDGVDYLRLLTDCLQSSKFTNQELHEIFLYWGHGVFRRIFEDDYQNECVILKGGQGIGKDNWVKSLVKGFGQYYEGIEVQDIGEMVPAVQRIYIAHLEEFDQTRKIDVAELKALITKPTSFFREKYARSASRKPMKASWISTVNVDDIFRDPTGNRRFIVIPLEFIVWDYPKDISLKILSQFKACKPHKLCAETKAKIDEIIEQMTPDDTGEYIEELVLHELREVFSTPRIDNRIPYRSMAETWLKIARLQQCSVRRVQSVAKKYQILSNGKWYCKKKVDEIGTSTPDVY